ncbi:MAG: thiamine-monophosphate kinase [Ignavibacteriaceae bacterium]|nr:thiamine-monophosphate kinase [Ignavibacteriaceae bacterium]
MEKSLEVDFINSIAEKFMRSPLQMNKIHQSDAEIIKLNCDSEIMIAITADTISEEIKFGLYDNPFLIGWMAVVVNMSDLAAVGASPLGIVVAESFTHNLEKTFISKIQEGIEAACRACNTFMLGGDISSTDQLSLTGCAIGILQGKKFLSRIGCIPGDIIYSTGKLGRGNSFALKKFNRLDHVDLDYKPIARLRESKSLINFAKCCMDTSDGFVSTLDQIRQLNNCGIKLIDDWESIIDEDAKVICKKLNIPLWFLLAGYHGEFELVFAVSPDLEGSFLSNCKKNNWKPIKIGRVIDSPQLILNLNGKEKNVDSSFIRNLSFQHSSDVKSYIKALFEYDEKLR